MANNYNILYLQILSLPTAFVHFSFILTFYISEKVCIMGWSWYLGFIVLDSQNGNASFLFILFSRRRKTLHCENCQDQVQRLTKKTKSVVP